MSDTLKPWQTEPLPSSNRNTILIICALAIATSAMIFVPQAMERKQAAIDASFSCTSGWAMDVKLYGRYSKEAQKTLKLNGCSPK